MDNLFISYLYAQNELDRNRNFIVRNYKHLMREEVNIKKTKLINFLGLLIMLLDVGILFYFAISAKYNSEVARNILEKVTGEFGPNAKILNIILPFWILWTLSIIILKYNYPNLVAYRLQHANAKKFRFSNYIILDGEQEEYLEWLKKHPIYKGKNVVVIDDDCENPCEYDKKGKRFFIILTIIMITALMLYNGV